MSFPSSFVIPSFAEPRTRTEFDNTILKLTDFYAKQGFGSESSTLATLTINLKQQGLKDADIQKQIQQHLDTKKQKEAAKQAEIAKLQAQQQPLLDQLKKEQEARAKQAAQAQEQRRVLTPAELKAQNNASKPEPMVADPRNPRGPLIPKSLYDQIIAEQTAQGKYTVNTTGNPETDRIRTQIEAEKAGTANPVVIGVNRSYVQLSNGQLIPRDQYKGTIPPEFLTAEKKEPQFPTSYNSQQDPEIIAVMQKLNAATNVTNPIKPDVSATKSTDPVKRRPDSVFKPSEPLPPEKTLGGLIDTTVKTISDVLVPKTEQTSDTKQEPAFDPLKAVGDTLGAAVKGITDLFGGAAKTVSDAVAAATTPAATPATPPKQQPAPEPKVPVPPYKPYDPNDPSNPAGTHGDPIEQPTPQKETTAQKAVRFLADHSTAIVVGVAALSFMGALAFTLPKARQSIMEQR